MRTSHHQNVINIAHLNTPQPAVGVIQQSIISFSKVPNDRRCISRFENPERL